MVQRCPRHLHHSEKWESKNRGCSMRIEAHRTQLNVAKVVLTITAMMSLYPLLWIITDPVYSWCESAAVGREIGGIGWILNEATRLMAIFIISFLSGVLFTRDRWIARLAATIWLLWLLFCPTQALMHLSSAGQREVVSLYVRSWTIPLLYTSVIAFLFSPFFHDCGRLLRGHFRKRGDQGQPRS
jgi:hypothetical protein